MQETIQNIMHIIPEPKLEPFRGKSIKVYDVSGEVEEAPAVSCPGLYTVPADLLFFPGTVFMGFGIPNVYMAHVKGPKNVLKVAAKSLYRGDMKVEQTKGRVQSGVMLVMRGLTAEEVEEVAKESYLHEGNLSVTCLNENLSILAASGFHVPGVDLTSYKFPHVFMEDMLAGMPITFKGKEVEIDIVKTTPKTLEEHYNAIYEATQNTPLRHFRRAWDDDEAKNARKQIAIQISKENEERLVKLKAEKEVMDSGEIEIGPTYTVLVSETSSLGAYFRSLWGSHVIYKLQLDDELQQLTKKMLPDTLKEFNMPSPSLFTKIKKNYLFSQSVVDMLQRQMASGFTKYDNFTQYNLYNMLKTEKDGDEVKYNFVVTNREVIIVSNSVYYGFVDWVLSKHVLICGYSDHVLFAGEIRKDKDTGLIHLNNNSGTYRPSIQQLNNCVKLAHFIFPGLEFVADVSDLLSNGEEGTQAEEWSMREGGEMEEEKGQEEEEKEEEEEEKEEGFSVEGDWVEAISWDLLPDSPSLSQLSSLRSRLGISSSFTPLRLSHHP